MPIIDLSRVPRLQLATPVRSPSIVRPPLTLEQRTKLESLAVDRSHFRWYALPRWSHEGEDGDAYVVRIHRETTEGERMAAWRCLFRGEDLQGH